MKRRLPGSTRTYTLFPFTSLCRWARVGVSGRRAEDGGYVIELADNGPGMAEEYRPGSLGKRLVELLASKGGIRVDRLDGPGTRYRISAPVEPRGGRDQIGRAHV